MCYIVITFYILLYSVVFYGECIIYSGSPDKSMYISKKVCPFGRTFISTYTTLLSNRIYPICKHVPPFAFATSRRKRGMGKGNRFF